MLNQGLALASWHSNLPCVAAWRYFPRLPNAHVFATAPYRATPIRPECALALRHDRKCVNGVSVRIPDWEFSRVECNRGVGFGVHPTKQYPNVTRNSDTASDTRTGFPARRDACATAAHSERLSHAVTIDADGRKDHTKQKAIPSHYSISLVEQKDLLPCVSSRKTAANALLGRTANARSDFAFTRQELGTC